MSVVIFTNFKDTLNLLEEKLNVKCIIHGGQTQKQRDKAIDDFQANKEKIIIC